MTKINYPEEFKKAAQPLFLSNSFFGLGVIEYPVGKPHRILSYFYVANIFIVYVFASIYSVSYFKEYGHHLLANQFTMKIVFGSNVFLTISTILLGRRRNEEWHLILERILAADLALQKIGIEPNYREVHKSQLRKMISYILTIWINMTIINILVLYKEDITIEKIALVVVFSFPIIILSIGDASFLNGLQYLIMKLKKLNNLLKSKLSSTRDCPQYTNFLKFHKKSVNAQRNSISLSTDMIRDDSYVISMARIGHLEFTKCCETLTQVFAYHILTSMLVTIITLTGCFYHSYALLRSDNMKIANYWVFAILGAVVIYHTLRIYLFTKYCSDVTQESIITGDIIAEMYNENISEKCKIEKISLGNLLTDFENFKQLIFRAPIQELLKSFKRKKRRPLRFIQIRQFEIQLIQRPLRIHILYTTTDYSFIQKAIGTITTYLIILTQCGNVTIEIPEQ